MANRRLLAEIKTQLTTLTDLVSEIRGRPVGPHPSQHTGGARRAAEGKGRAPAKGKGKGLRVREAEYPPDFPSAAPAWNMDEAFAMEGGKGYRFCRGVD